MLSDLLGYTDFEDMFSGWFEGVSEFQREVKYRWCSEGSLIKDADELGWCNESADT
jgi:hypothetical protein